MLGWGRMFTKAVMCGGDGVGVNGRDGELPEQDRVCNAPFKARQGLRWGHAVAASRCLASCRPWLNTICWLAICTTACPQLPCFLHVCSAGVARPVAPLSRCMHTREKLLPSLGEHGLAPGWHMLWPVHVWPLTFYSCQSSRACLYPCRRR